MDEFEPSTSDEIKSCFASVSCQTDEDPNKTVIDKLRKRIDDLEQDLKETKEKLNFQEQNKENSSCIVKESETFITQESKKKVRKLIASFEETFQQNGTRHEGVVKTNSENQQDSFEKKISELKAQWEKEKAKEINKLKAEIQVKHDQEMVELREKEAVQRKNFAENLKRITNEQERQEIDNAKQALQKRHQEELNEIRNVFEQKQREIDETTTNLQRRHVAGVNELRAVFQQRRQRELEGTKSSLIRCHEMELNELRAAMNRERENVISEVRREQERVLRQSVRDAKRKQWCCNCEQEASYPCTLQQKSCVYA